MEESFPCRGSLLSLIRLFGTGESANPHDAKTVRVGWNGHKLGCVPRTQNQAVAQRLARGVPLTARVEVLTASRDPWDRVRIAVLMDA